MGRSSDRWAVARVEVGVGRAIRQIAAIHHRLTGVARLLALHASDAENFGADSMSKDFALELGDALCWSAHSEARHDLSFRALAHCRLEAG